MTDGAKGSEARLNKRTASWIRFLLAAASLVGAGLFLRSRSQAENVPPHQGLASLPLRLGDWAGKDFGIQPEVREVLGEGDFLARVYQRPAHEPFVDLFIAYFPSQRTGATIHSPQNCLPGSGWTPLESTRIQLAGSGREPITVNRYLIAKGMDRQLVLYWYQAHGRVVASEYWAKFYLVADTMRTNRSDGALVRILTPMVPEESIGSAQNRAVAFEKELAPLLASYLPD